MIRILILDSHDIVRAALETRLRAAVGIEVIGSSGEYAQAARQAHHLLPDIILLETKAPSGIDTLKMLCGEFPNSAVIVLTSYPDSHEEEKTLTLGASRYLLKTLNTKELVKEIRVVARQHHPPVNPPVAAAM